MRQAACVHESRSDLCAATFLDLSQVKNTLSRNTDFLKRLLINKNLCTTLCILNNILDSTPALFCVYRLHPQGDQSNCKFFTPIK